MNKNMEKYIDYALILLAFVFLVMFLNDKRQRYNTSIYELNVLKKDILNKNIELENLYDKNNKINNEIEKENRKIKKELDEIDKNYSLSSNEFKKMIYKFSNDSGLVLEDITNEQKLRTYFDYSLLYVGIKLKGDLVSLSKFIYMIQNANKYIDGSKFSMTVTSNSFILNLGYINNGDIND